MLTVMYISGVYTFNISARSRKIINNCFKLKEKVLKLYIIYEILLFLMLKLDINMAK